MNVDEEADLKDKHEITSYPTLKMVHDDEEGSVVSDIFDGDTESAASIVTHVVSETVRQ